MMATSMNYKLDEEAVAAMRDYIAARKAQPHFANARSVRNALDRARLRQANRVFEAALKGKAAADADTLSLIGAADIRASRVFSQRNERQDPAVQGKPVTH
jgi:hypothetical protein